MTALANGNKRALLRLSAGSYATAIVARNAANRVLSMDLDGFFSHAFLLFFKADADDEFHLSPRHTVLDVAVVPPGRGTSGAIRAQIGFLYRALRLIRRHRVVAIQANDPYVTGFNALLLSRLTGIPYVIEVVDAYDLSQAAGGYRYIPLVSSRAFEKKVERTVLRQAHAVYADRDFYVKYALANGARPAHTHRVRCVTDPFYYTAGPQRPLSAYVDTAGRKVMLYVGGLRPCKNVIDLVPCLARVRSAGEDVVLVIVGDGPLRADIEQRATELGVRDSLAMLGHRSAQELVDIMHCSDVLLAPHAGYALIEMALSGKPIVAYDYEWHPEVVQHERTGLLAKYGDAEALGDQALRVLRNPDLARSLGQAAREFVLANHDCPGAIQDERHMYEQLIGA
jgi:glycosyltransferase involved in cell wall biosynthesis